MFASNFKGQFFFVLAGFQPTEICRRKAILCLARCAQELEHLLHERIVSHISGIYGNSNPFVLAAIKRLNDFAQSDTSVTKWMNCKRNIEWRNNTFRLHSFIADVSTAPLEMFIPRPAWVRLNRLGTGVGLSRSTTHNGVWLLLRDVNVVQSIKQLST